MWTIIKLLVLAIILVADVKAAPLDELLDSMVDAYGGEASLRRADRMVQEWDIVALMGNRHGTDRRSVSLPDRLKVELEYEHKREIRLLDGDTGTVMFGDSGPVAARPPQRDAMRLQLMRLYSALALRDRTSLMKQREVNGHIVLTLQDFGLRADYFVNPENYRIEKVIGYLPMNGHELTFSTEYSDFFRVDGILTHRRENKFVGSRHTAVLQLRDIRFGVELSDVDFTLDNGTRQENLTIAKK